MKRIFQDKWFEDWFIRKDGLLRDRFIEIAWILRHLYLNEGNILDVGCGASFYPLLLSLQGFNVIAVDSHNYDYDFPNYRFIKSNAYNLGGVLLGMKFDRILLISVLHHIGFQQKPYGKDVDIDLIRKLNNLFSDIGCFLITVPFGEYKELSNFRIYNQERIELLFPNIIKQEYFIRKKNIWEKTTREIAEEISYEKSPAQCITCLIAEHLL